MSDDGRQLTIDPALVDGVATVARLAGDIALAYFGRALTVEAKRDGSPVTIADREAERAAREWIATRHRRDGVLGEEMGGSGAAAGRRWLIDPIDGTASFIRGVPLWGTLVAVAEGDHVLAGAAYLPALGELLVASRGGGCWRRGERCRVSAVSEIGRATVLTTDERFARRPDRRDGWLRLAERAALSRTWGDCYGYLLVATGCAEVMVDPQLSAWDGATFVPIIEEAGGVLTDWSGARTPFGGSAIASNGALAVEARTLLCPPSARTREVRDA